MDIGTSFILIILLSALMYYFSVRKVQNIAVHSKQKPQSLLRYYGQLTAIWCLLPSILILLLYSFIAPQWIDYSIAERISELYPEYSTSAQALAQAQVNMISQGLIKTDNVILQRLADETNQTRSWLGVGRIWLIVLVTLISGGWIYLRTKPELAARQEFELILRRLFLAAAMIAIIITISIVASLLIESVRFFTNYSISNFLFGLHWSPNIALHEDQVGSSGLFGMIPVLGGTILVSLIAMCVSVPIGLFSAIYMSEFAHPRFRNMIKPALEVLAGIPTVVYGFFAALIVAPFFRNLGISFGLDVSSESALAAGVVMGMMIIPFISSLSDDVIQAVPISLRDAALGLGATRAEVINRVLLPAAFPGLVGAFLLAISRAIGETMIVVMAVGTAARLTINPLDSVTTVTVQIVGLLTGDTEFDSIKTLSAFALGITLFCITLVLNIAALTLSRRLAEKYE